MQQRNSVSFLSQWTFSYFGPLAKLGSTRELELRDFPLIETIDNSFNLSKDFNREWNESRNLKSLIFKVFGKRYMSTFIWYLLESGCKIGTAVFLGELLAWIGGNQNISIGLLLAFGMLACQFGSMVLHHVIFFVSTRIGMNLRVGFIGIIYEKCLLLSGSDSSMTGIIGNFY